MGYLIFCILLADAVLSSQVISVITGMCYFYIYKNIYIYRLYLVEHLSTFVQIIIIIIIME